MIPRFRSKDGALCETDCALHKYPNPSTSTGSAERTAYSQEKKVGAGPQNEATRIRAKPSEAGRKANAPALL